MLNVVSLLFVLSQCVLAQLSSMAVLFHVNYQLQRDWPIKFLTALLNSSTQQSTADYRTSSQE